MSRRSSRGRKAPPGIEALPQGVQKGLRLLVISNKETIATMLDKDTEAESDEALAMACAEVMGQQQLNAESFLARFMCKAVLASYCREHLGKSDNGNEATLAARIARVWSTPSFLIDDDGNDDDDDDE